ncbi:hypothetical protein K502DRAFT_264206 [Neoconidiobolus thromboides FSU 785]|nr:hypothetical protein K502DRAFT_264206 [Neoconidiobolus thromboides FSU 785]
MLFTTVTISFLFLLNSITTIQFEMSKIYLPKPNKPSPSNSLFLIICSVFLNTKSTTSSRLNVNKNSFLISCNNCII